MKCPKCGAENAEGNRFCGYCGETIREPAPSAHNLVASRKSGSSSQAGRSFKIPSLSITTLALGTLLVLSVISCFLPWMSASVTVGDQNTSTTNYGYDYIAPLDATYASPVAILSVIGFVLVAYSFRATDRIKMLIVLGGILISIGAIAAFINTSSAAIADTSGSLNYSVNVEGRYGMGLEVLFGILITIVGARKDI